MVAKLPSMVVALAGRGHIVDRPLDHRPQIHGRHRQLLRARKPQEVGDHFAQRDGLGANPFDARARLLGQRLRIEQPAVAVNGREAVAEFVREAGGELAEARERFLEAQLLFELRPPRSDR